MKPSFWKYVSTWDNAIVFVFVAVMWTVFSLKASQILADEDYLTFFLIGGIFSIATISWILGNIFSYRDYIK